MTLTDTQKQAAEEGFVRLIAAQELMHETRRAAPDSRRASLMITVRDAIRGKITMDAFLKQFNGTIPPQMRTLVHGVIAARTRGYSPVALAASSGDISVRVVDECKITYVTDVDAIFLVIELAAKYAELPPNLIIAINADTGAVSTRTLPKPIRNTIQLGLRRTDAIDAEAIELLTDPMAELYLD